MQWLQSLKYPVFFYLFYSFVTEWILEILYLHVRVVLGCSQSNQTITTLSPVLALQRPCPMDQELQQDTSVTMLTLLVTSPALAWLCSRDHRNGLPGRPHWQERFLSTAWLDVPQAVNNGTKWWILFLLWKFINFIPCPCSGGFHCFPKKRFYCTSQTTELHLMFLPVWEQEQGLEHGQSRKRSESVCLQYCQSTTVFPTWSISAMPALLVS